MAMATATAVLRRSRVLHLMGAAISKPLPQTEAITAMAALRLPSTPSHPWSYVHPFSSSAAAVHGGGGGGGAPGAPGGCGGGEGASPAGGGPSAPAPGGVGCASAPTFRGGDAPDAALDELCYTIGQHGVLSFHESAFIPLDAYLSEFPLFDEVPEDRLIHPVDPDSPNFTSLSASEWMRSGFVSAVCAHDLGIMMVGALCDGNVGVIKGTNLLVFRNIKLTTAETQTAEKYPFTVSGFASYLEEKLAMHGKLVPDGLQALLKHAKTAPPKEFHLVIYNPEFLNRHGKYILFIEVHRLLRVQMPVQNEDALAYSTMLRIDRRLSKKKKMAVSNDPILSNWMVKYKRNLGKGLAGILQLNVQPGSKLDLTKLSPMEHLQLVNLAAKAYVPPSTTSPPASTTSTLHAATSPSAKVTKVIPWKPSPVTWSGKPIPTLPMQAKIIELHRHAMAHIIEQSILALIKNLPAVNQASIQSSPLVWQDGLMLLEHRVPGYLSIAAEAFDFYDIWKRLGLESLLPFPKVLTLPSKAKQEQAKQEQAGL